MTHDVGGVQKYGETFSIQIYDAKGGASISSNQETRRIFIEENGDPVLLWNETTFTVREDQGTANVTIKRVYDIPCNVTANTCFDNTNCRHGVSVGYFPHDQRRATGGSPCGTTNVDFLNTEPAAIFPCPTGGDADTVTVSVTICNDGEYEDDELVRLGLIDSYVVNVESSSSPDPEQPLVTGYGSSAYAFLSITDDGDAGM